MQLLAPENVLNCFAYYLIVSFDISSPPSCDGPLAYIDFQSIEVFGCECSTIAQVLVHFGFFPIVPSQPRIAVLIDLLSFYCALFEWSCDAINALASALHVHYSWRGFRVVNKNMSTLLLIHCCSIINTVPGRCGP
jgi:hypothetical protein